MDAGLQMVFSSYGWDDISDERVWDEEIALARLAVDLGFDVLWAVEHHFNDFLVTETGAVAETAD